MASSVEEALKGTRCYEKESIPVLEECVGTQLKKCTYNLEANLCLLKLYLLYPEETKVPMLEAVLLKSVMNFPGTDFSLCMYQIPQRYHEQLKEPMSLAQRLEMAKFKQFWKEAEGVERLKEADGWADSVRRFIASVVEATYKSINRAHMGELLNLPLGKDFDKFVKNYPGWEDAGELIIVNKTPFGDANAESRTEHSTLSLDHYKCLVGSTTIDGLLGSTSVGTA